MQWLIVMIPLNLLDWWIGLDPTFEIDVGAFGEILGIQIRSQRQRHDGSVCGRKQIGR